jgi:hypothetical protein
LKLDESGFAGSYFPSQQDETLTGVDAVRQASQRFLRIMREE